MDFGVNIPVISYPGSKGSIHFRHVDGRSRWGVLVILKAPLQWYHPAGRLRRQS